MRRKPWFLGVMALAAAALPSIAHAYLEPAEAILEKVASHRAALAFDTLVAEGYRDDEEERASVWTGLLANRALRTEWKKAGGTEVELVVGQQRHVFTQGGPKPPPVRILAAPLLELLGITRPDPGGQRGRALLARLRVDPAIVTLTRHDDRPAYVIGAQPGELDRPQLWVDKASYVPVRWISSQQGSLVDVRLYGYHLPTGPWFPEVVEIWRGERLERRTVYTQVRLNARLDRRRFAAPTR